MKSKRIARTIAKIYLCYNRGGALIHWIIEMVQNFAIIGILVDFFFNHFSMTIPIWVVAIVVGAKPITQIIIGFTDFKLGFWRVEAEISSRKINPFLKRLEDRLIRLEKNQTKHDKL